MNFPVVTGKQDSYPKGHRCPICLSEKALASDSHVALSGGAALKAPEGHSGPSDAMLGYLFLTWSSTFTEGDGSESAAGTLIPIADRVRGGQFRFSFCSTACLRSFLNGCVDELEKSVAREQKNLRRRLKKQARGLKDE